MFRYVLLSVAFCFTEFIQAQSTSIPDANFEQTLVNQGIDSDGMVNGTILNSDATAVTALFINGDNISDLTGIAAFTSIVQLNCGQNNLSSLDLSSNTVLEILYCDDNNLNTLDLSNNTLLQDIRCSRNQLSSLTLPASTSLTFLSASSNNLTSINTSSNTSLEYFSFGDNQLTSIDVSNNLLLDHLLVYQNQLSGTIDVSNHNALAYISVDDNQLSGLTFGNPPNGYGELELQKNQLTSIDLSSASFLSLNCDENQLTSLNIKNGNNTQVGNFSALLNPNLTCIEVDDPAYSTAATATWQKDAVASYSNNCSTVGVAEDNLVIKNIQVYPNPSTDVFTIEFQGKEKYTLGVSDVLGKTIYISEQPSNGPQQVNLGTFPKGIYFLQIALGGQLLTKRISIR